MPVSFTTTVQFISRLKMQISLDEYYKESRKSLRKSTKVIKNPNIFDFNYIPKGVFIRKEAKVIMDSIVKFDGLKAPFNLLIYGSRGSGKTVLLKYLMNYLKTKNKTPTAYINCRLNNTTFKILSALLERNGRGLGTHELYQALRKVHSRLVVILDEVDLLSDREKNRDILYFLSRSEKKYMVILLSNNPSFYNKIDLSTKSTLQLEKMHFRNYNAEEVYEILKSRCKEGLKQYRYEDLRKISALTSKESNGDIRIAIKTLQYTVTTKYDRIETNFEKAREDIYFDLLFNQSDQIILILKAIQSTREKLVKIVYTTYKKLCRAHTESAFSYMHFYNNLSYLQSMGLILMIATKVHRGKSNSIELLFDEGILKQIFSQRFLK